MKDSVPVAAIVGIFLLAAAVTLGVIYVQQNQDIRDKAAQESRVSQIQSMTEITGDTDAKVGGYICPYMQAHPSGTVVFYDVDRDAIAQQGVATGQKVYTISLPRGNYIALFAPDNLSWPTYAYTNYVSCGLNPAQCTNHEVPILGVSAGTYGNIDLCDAQFLKEGVPDTLLSL